MGKVILAIGFVVWAAKALIRQRARWGVLFLFLCTVSTIAALARGMMQAHEAFSASIAPEASVAFTLAVLTFNIAVFAALALLFWRVLSWLREPLP